MKKWKIIFIITLLILITFLIFTIYKLVICYTADIHYPHPMLGIDAYNWLDVFCVNIALYLYMFFLPLSITSILFITSIIKMRKYKKRKI